MKLNDFFGRITRFIKARVISGSGRTRGFQSGLIPRHDANQIESDYGSKQRAGLTDLRDFLLLYKSHPSVYAAASDVAQLAASVKIQVEKNNKRVKDGDLVRLFKRPNPNESWITFLTVSILYLELCGNCFWELVRDDMGQLKAIYNLRPDRMSILPHPTEKIAGYVYRPTLETAIAFDKFEICHFKYPDPDDEFWGCSSLESAKSALMLDFYAAAWNKNFFMNGAEPGGTLETDQGLTEQAFKRLLETWNKRHKGAQNAHAVAILEEGLKYKPIGFKHSDMQFDIMRKMSKEEIYEAMRVPMGWRNETVKKKSFWMDNIIPKLEMIQEVINTFLINPIGTIEEESFSVQFMTRNILSMIEEDAVKSQIANQNVTHGIWTQNEAREILYGMEGVDWGDTYWMPVGLMEWDQVGAYGESTLPSDHNIDNDTQGGDRAGRSHPSQTPKLDRESRLDRTAKNRHPEVGKAIVMPSEYIDIDKMIPEFPSGGDAMDFWAYKKWLEFAKKAGKDERNLIQTMREFFKMQLERHRGKIRAHYEPRKVRKAEEEPEPNVDAMLLDLSRENRLLFQVYQAKAGELLRKYGQDAMTSIGAQIDFDMDTQAIQDVMNRVAAAKVSKINEYTRELMRRSLVESVQKGEDFHGAMARLGEIFEPQGGISLLRARRIARTELITFANAAKLDAAEQSGMVEKKMWICQLLPTSRKEVHGANHVAMHKKVVDISQDFLVQSRAGVEAMNGPGDFSASAENLVNCLCQLEFPPTAPELQELFEEAVERPVARSKRTEEEVNINIYTNGKGKDDIEVEKGDETPVGPKQPWIIQPIINIPEIKIPDFKMPEIKVNVDVPKQEAPNVTVNVPKQDAPVIKVDVPKQDAPNVTVNVPKQDAPVVNVNPSINLEQTESEKFVERDSLGRIVRTFTTKEIKNKPSES